MVRSGAISFVMFCSDKSSTISSMLQFSNVNSDSVVLLILFSVLIFDSVCDEHAYKRYRPRCCRCSTIAKSYVSDKLFYFKIKFVKLGSKEITFIKFFTFGALNVRSDVCSYVIRI